ncbi:hypothetical protein V1477_003662 [Vespula maculifrons]|uniref:Uncharacterized protein n=1 Tax=Vespula maculifrons TaxID=7453 RepID=A0ABD2CVB5_VESMC
MRREENKSVRTREKDEAEKKRKKRISTPVKKMKLERKYGHGKEKKRKDIPEQNRSTKIQLDYSLEFDRENLGKILKNAAIRSVILAVYEFPMYHKYFRPRSHRVEVAASGDPRTNESKATGRSPLPTNSSLQTLKLQPHASPHLGTDLRIAQLSNIGSFDHHLSTTDCASRQTPEPKIESSRTHRYLHEYSGNTHASMLSTLEPMLDLNAPENTNAYASRHKRVSFYLARTGEKKSFYA